MNKIDKHGLTMLLIFTPLAWLAGGLRWAAAAVLAVSAANIYIWAGEKGKEKQ